MGQPRRTKFPPISPMDLLDDSQPSTKGSHSALESVSTAMSDSECSQNEDGEDDDDDDMELEVEDLVSSALIDVRPPFEMEMENDAGAETELSFGALGADDLSLLRASQGSEDGIMRVGDLEMVREEAESDYSKLDEAHSESQTQSQSETRRSYQQIQIGNKLAKLKSRGKQK